MAKGTKRGFLDSVEQYNLIMEQLLVGKWNNIYFLCGEEMFFVDKIASYIAQNVLEESDRSFNQFVLYGSETTAMELSDVCRQYPMGADKSVVILKEAHAVKGFDSFLDYAQSPLTSTIVVICYNGTLNKTQKLYKAISKNGVYFESNAPRDYELQGWLMNHIRSRGLSIDAVSVSLIIESAGVSITKIDNELNKLINSIDPGKKVITVDDIEKNIGISKEFNNFELTKALSELNVYKALQIADYFGRNAQKNPFQLTVISIFNHFNKIFKLGLIKWECKTKSKPQPTDIELASSLQIGSTFFLKEYNQALVNYPLKKLFTIFGIIRHYEMKGKGVDAGSADGGELLKELICKIVNN